MLIAEERKNSNRKKKLFLNKGSKGAEPDLLNALGIIILQFSRYSSSVQDSVNLSMRFSTARHSETLTLDFFLTEDQSFQSMIRILKRNIASSLHPFQISTNIKTEIEWLLGEQGSLENPHCIITTDLDNDPVKIQFESKPGSRFHLILNEALQHFHTIKSQIEADPTILIGSISCFQPIEMEAIHSFAYGGRVPFSGDLRLHELFEQVVDNYPAQIAIRYKNQDITYDELNAKANRLAHVLVQKGIKPGEFVGILLERSPEAYISILGILKSGAAYVPLDPTYPKDRVQFILKDSGINILISSTTFVEKYQGFAGTVVNLSGGLHGLNGFVHSNMGWNENSRIEFATQSPAYVIYTSGSSGNPKGVAISHSAITNLVVAEREIFNLCSGDQVLQGFSLAFDASLEEIWLAFSRGATLVPASRELMCSGEALSHFIEQEKISVLSTVPTLLSAMVPRLPSLRILILGGEACSHQLLERWYTPKLRIVNTYGPTEATVIATYDDFHPNGKITIGRPIQNYAAFITDSRMRLVPSGVPGELCLAGQGLANGYLNRDELTKEKFIEATFPIRYNLGQRLYRTGDLAMVNAEGKIEFLGRIDTQVKLRGYRIELAEIESQLMQFPNIQSAIVDIRTDHQEVERLVAYFIVYDTSLVFDEKNCREFLSARLAPYMVPALFVELPDFPILPSGKVNRKQLPDPGDCQQLGTRPVVEPRTENEKRIQAVWKKCFAPHDVSVTDNFFHELGGHSLLAAKMVSEIRQWKNFEHISVADVYRYPTIEQLAKVMVAKPQPVNGQSRKEHAHRHVSTWLQHAWCGLLQFLSLYFVFGFSSVLSVSGYLVYFYFYLNNYSWIESAAWALASPVVIYPMVVFTAIGLKWLLLGRIKPGRYKLWGWFYFRWWLVQNIAQVIGLSHFAGTPILPFLFKLLGVKVGKDVHINSDHLAAYDLISIGDGCSLDGDVKLSGFSVRDGYLHLGTITIGKRCFIGERSVVREGAVMEDDARLEDLSLLPPNTTIPAGETWEGSPARFKHAMLPLEVPHVFSKIRRAAIALLYIALSFVLPVVSFVSFIPGIALLFQSDILQTPWTFMAILPIVGASFVILLVLETIIIKWVLVGRVKPGRYPVHGSFYIRNWVVEQLQKFSLSYAGQLHATLHVVHWYRALGMKIGRLVELSTAVTATPDLVNLSDGSTIADEASLGSPHIERGWMRVDKVKLGKRAFVGNSGVVPTGREMGDGSLVGVLSIAPNAQNAKQPNTTWFGSPSIVFPKRETSSVFTEGRTYNPPRWMKVARGSFELFRILLPPIGFIIVAATMLNFVLNAWYFIGLLPSLLLLPIVFGITSGLVVLVAAALKWLIIGRYKPFVKPLWSNFVWRLELVNALYEFLSAPLVLQSLQGTPFLSWYLRLMGAKIGKMCYIETTGFLEWDLIEIGDRTSIGEDSVMQTHLFEDRILKASHFKIGADCSVGAASVVLYDTIMQDNSHLDALSLLMKGETLPVGTHWGGIPALSEYHKHLV